MHLPRDPDCLVIHPASWMSATSMLDLQLKVHQQRCVDLVAVADMAKSLGVTIDVPAAIKGFASVSDVLDEIKDTLLLKNKLTASEPK